VYVYEDEEKYCQDVTTIAEAKGYERWWRKFEWPAEQRMRWQWHGMAMEGKESVIACMGLSSHYRSAPITNYYWA